MDGENYATNTWPSCGEIDIMEFKEANLLLFYGTLHYPGNSGGNGNSGSTTVANLHLNFTFTKPSGLPLQ
jgi:beta-glucanase (GH16 family)